jgi:hypothetical protein
MGNQALAKLSGNITATIGGKAIGGAAFAGRQSVGRLANWAAENDWLKDRAAKSRVGALALQATRGVAGSSFDARGSRVFSGVATATGVGEKGLGEVGGKGGYRQGIKDAAGRETTFAADAIGKVSKKVVDANVATEKGTRDTAETAWLSAKTDPTKTKQDIERAKQTFDAAEKAYKKAYTKEENKNLENYSNRLKASIILGPSRQKAGGTIAKELEKALKDTKGNYDVLKNLRVDKK